MPLEVRTRNIAGESTAVGSAGAFTVIVDRPREAGGGGLGFSGGQLLYLAVAGCVSNDLFREASRRGIALDRVEVTVRGDFPAEGAPSTAIEYDVALSGSSDDPALRELVALVDGLAEIPNSLRNGTPVRLGRAEIRSDRS